MLVAAGKGNAIDLKAPPGIVYDGLFPNLEYMLGNPAIFPNPMYNIPGVTPLTVRIDWMHTKFSVLANTFSGRFCSACAIS